MAEKHLGHSVTDDPPSRRRRQRVAMLVCIAAAVFGIGALSIRAIYQRSQANALIAAVEARNTREVHRLLKAGVDPCHTLKRFNIHVEPGDSLFYELSPLLQSLHLNRQDITRSLFDSVTSLPDDASTYLLCAIRKGDRYAMRQLSHRGVSLAGAQFRGQPLIMYSLGGGSVGTLACIASEMLRKGESLPSQVSAGTAKVTDPGVLTVLCLLSEAPRAKGEPSNRSRTLQAIEALAVDPAHLSSEDICGWPAWIVGLALAESGDIGLRIDPAAIQEWTPAHGPSALDIIATTCDAKVVAHFATSAVARGDTESLQSALTAAFESFNWDAAMALVDAGADPTQIDVFRFDARGFLNRHKGSSATLDALRQMVGSKAP